MDISLLESFIAPLKRKVMLMLGRAIITAIDDSKSIQEMKIELLAGETKEGVERMQNYGFTSHPHKDSEALCGFVGGNRSHGVIFVVDDRKYRLKNLEKGEVAIYTDEGDKLHFKRGNKLEITTNDVKINAAKVDIGGSGLEAVLNGETFQTFFNAHTHIGNLGAPTAPPTTASDPSHLSTKVKAAK